jgi:hypothetical protein
MHQLIMRGTILFFLLFLLPVRIWADGIVLPTLAYPAQVTIPDQQAALSFSNGVERLVIETRFTGAGTNFAWVVPFPNQPFIEQATAGFFPTVRFLCVPKIIHEVPHNYACILALIGIGSLLMFVRPTGQIKWTDVLACVCVGMAAATSSEHATFNCFALLLVVAILFCDVVLIRVELRPPCVVFGLTFGLSFCLWSTLLPAGMSLSRKAIPSASAEKISVLDRKIIGVFETTTIASHDVNALQTWLSDNGYLMPTNSAPVIASYVRDGWVFVATKVHRENATSGTDTPHPLSFTFKTEKPVYPMRLTGLGNRSLNVDLYVFGNTSATAPHFAVESSTQQELFHPLLSRWFGSQTVVTKLTATLSPANMGEDVWVNLSPTYLEHQNHFYSQPGALNTALNCGAYVFGIGLLIVGGLSFASSGCRRTAPRLIFIVLLAGTVVGALRYEALPQMEVRLVKGGWRDFLAQVMVLRMALNESGYHTAADARAAIQATISNPTNADYYGLKDWDNYYVGGQFREEDSPGNYVLRETNNLVKLIPIGPDGREDDLDELDVPLRQ